MSTAMTQEFADASAAFNDRLTNIQESFGQLAAVLFMDVFPIFDGLVAFVEKAVVAFTNMPEPVRAVVSGVVAFGTAATIAVGALGLLVAMGAKVVAGFVAIKGALAAVAFGTTIAGWAGAAAPAVAAITATLGGILTFVTGTLLPGLLAVFSGPVGWTVLAVAAVVALAVAFREPLMQFATWLWAWGEPIRQFWIGLWQGVGGMFEQFVVDPIKAAWTGIVEFLRGVVQNAAGALQGAWQAIAGGIIGAFQSVVNTVGRVVNQVINAINTLIQGINAVRSAAGLGGINLIPQWNIPSFADGGVVKRPTLALVGEGGEQEYIIPESKMARAAENYLAGQRGDAVLAAQRFQMPMPTGGGGITVSPGSSPINITTGPVQQIDGRRYATIEDLESVAREVATQIYATLRTPNGRRAIGVGIR